MVVPSQGEVVGRVADVGADTTHGPQRSCHSGRVGESEVKVAGEEGAEGSVQAGIFLQQGTLRSKNRTWLRRTRSNPQRHHSLIGKKSEL